MCECCQGSSVDFFDSIASKWDSWEDIDSLNVKFDDALEKFGLKPDEHILDVGCGTGNLTVSILRHLSQDGKISAIDISSNMIEIAQKKVADSRVCWICDAVEHLDGLESVFDRIICYSVWPHLTNSQYAAELFFKLLKPGGKLHIWHLISRDMVNKIHSNASEAVSNHLLVPAEETSSLLESIGFVTEEIQDDETGYLVNAHKACL